MEKTGKSFVEISVKSIQENVFKKIEEDWFLITAGNRDNLNTMTANWGGFGYLWHKNVCFIFVRPSRYTFEFTEKNDLFTISFFNQDYRGMLDYCGTKSGKDVDKVKECGLNPVELYPGAPAFEEADLVLCCRKIYYQDINPKDFVDKGIDKNYPKKDYHRMYVGEILKVFGR